MGDLTETEAALLQKHEPFLQEIETTKMTKSFKMILLQAFQQLGGWQQAPTLATLAKESWSVLQRRPKLLGEVADNVRDTDGTDSKWQSYWKRNPVDHWTNKTPPFFRLEDDRLIPSVTLQPDEHQRATTPQNKRGRELINHQSLGQTIHLFVRDNKLRAGKAAPFTYHGPVEYQSHEGSAPMSVVFKLAQP